MLTIHKKQLETLQAALDERYVRDLVAWFREHHSAEIAEQRDEDLLALIADAMHRARRYGVRSPESLLQFIGMAVLVQRDFDSETAVRELFLAPGYGTDYKVQILHDALVKRFRDEGG